MNCPQCQQPTTAYYRHEKRHASTVEPYTKYRCPGCGWTCNLPAPTVRAFPGPGDRYVVARQARRARQRIAATYRREGPPVRFQLSYADAPSKPDREAKGENPLLATGKALDEWAELYGVKVRGSESDATFRERLLGELQKVNTGAVR